MMRPFRVTFLFLLGFALYCSGGDSQPCDTMVAQMGLEKKWVRVVTGGSRSRSVGLECAINSTQWAENGEAFQVYSFVTPEDAHSLLESLHDTEEGETEKFEENGRDYFISTEPSQFSTLCTYSGVKETSLLFLQCVPTGNSCRRDEIPSDREQIIQRFY